MGVKSTVFLTRPEAESRLVTAMTEYYQAIIGGGVKTMSDRDLEDLLEALNDAKYEHGGFDNYSICDEEEVNRQRYYLR